MAEIKVETQTTTPTAIEVLTKMAAKETTSQAARGMLDFTGAMVKRIDGTPPTSGAITLTPLDENLDSASEFTVAIDTKGIMTTIVNLN